MSNLKHIKAFVFDPATKPIIFADTKKPHELVAGEFGIFHGGSLLGVGTLASVTPVNTPVVQFHQNVGDNRHGTVRSKPISAASVKRYYAQEARNAAAQVTYIGYKETGTDDILIKKNQELTLVITVYEKGLARYYGQPYTKRIPIDLTACADCVTDCTVLNKTEVADAIVAAINDVAPVNGYPGTSELPNYMTAVKVSTGSGDTLKVGVKITGINATLATITNDPKQFFEPKITTFEVGVGDPCISLPISTTVVADAGEGWALMVADMERESQGYDRVRDQFEYQRFMKLADFIIGAQNGVKYDIYYIEFDEASHVPSAGPAQYNQDTHVIAIAVPTTGGATVEAFLNAWLTPLGHKAVNVSSSTNEGDANNVIEN
jgi:hypothetical protein